MTTPPVEVEDDLAVLVLQEELLRFPSFRASDAWALGNLLHGLALEAAQPVAVGIWLGTQTLFYAGTDGMVPGLEDWLRRKRNTVLRFAQSSLRVGLELARSGATLEGKHGVATADFAAHGGGFPLLLRGTGCVGVIGVSGLPQREDHALIVRALSKFLAVDVPMLK